MPTIDLHRAAQLFERAAFALDTAGQALKAADELAKPGLIRNQVVVKTADYAARMEEASAWIGQAQTDALAGVDALGNTPIFKRREAAAELSETFAEADRQRAHVLHPDLVIAAQLTEPIQRLASVDADLARRVENGPLTVDDMAHRAWPMVSASIESDNMIIGKGVVGALIWAPTVDAYTTAAQTLARLNNGARTTLQPADDWAFSQRTGIDLSNLLGGRKSSLLRHSVARELRATSAKHATALREHATALREHAASLTGAATIPAIATGERQRAWRAAVHEVAQRSMPIASETPGVSLPAAIEAPAAIHP